MATGILFPPGYLSTGSINLPSRLWKKIRNIMSMIVSPINSSTPHTFFFDLNDIPNVMEQILAYEAVSDRRRPNDDPVLIRDIQRMIRLETSWTFECQGPRLPIDQRIQLLEKALGGIISVREQVYDVISTPLYRDESAFFEIYIHRLQMLENELLEFKKWHVVFKDDVARGLCVPNREDLLDRAMIGYYGLAILWSWGVLGNFAAGACLGKWSDH
ncbi:unnamed protein product [Diplocarpon coronariae]